MKYIFTESQIKNIIDNVINEQAKTTQTPPVSGQFQGKIVGNDLIITTEDNTKYKVKLIDSKGIKGDVRGEINGKTLLLTYPKSMSLKLF